MTCTSSVAAAPLLSVTLRRNTYVPATKPETLVDALLAAENVATPPETLLHAYVMASPSGSEPEPDKETEFVGSVTALSDPAFAEGGEFTGGVTITPGLTVSST